MRKPVVICDFCLGPVEIASVIEATAGPLRARLPEPLDLCPTCCDRFVDLLRAGRLDDPAGLNGPLQATAIAAGTPLTTRRP